MGSIDAQGGRAGHSIRLVWSLVSVLVLAGALLMVWGSLHAGPVSEDSAALGYVHREGPWADLWGAQYGLRTVLFWRPLVTASLGLQEAVSGSAMLPLRVFNLACHVLSALLAAALARRLGGGWLAAAAAVAIAITFPYQGGTVTWIVGRVDSQCLPLVLLTAWASLAGRRWTAGLAALAALATKEAGAAAPLVAAALLWGRGDSVAATLRGALPAAVGTAVGLVARTLALGEIVGGYAPEGRPVGGDLWGGLTSAAVSLGNLPLALPALVVLGLLAGRARPRAIVGAALAALATVLPLVPLLDAGDLELVHRRWMLAPDVFLGLTLALCLGAPGPGRRARLVPTLAALSILLLVVGQRAQDARLDVRRWSHAANEASAHEQRTRLALEGVEPSAVPVLDATFPRVNADGSAYVAQWGVADRFREPFPSTPRPVWPWRRLFEAAQSPRGSVTTPRDGLRWPPGEAQLQVAPIVVEITDGGQPTDRVPLDLRLLADVEPGSGVELRVLGEYPGARIEFVVFTELGYGTGTWVGAPDAARIEPAADDPDGVLRSIRRLPLREVFLASNREGMPLYHVIRQAADLGAQVAYLELRAVDDARGKTDRPIAASAWIRLDLSDELRRAMLER
ncbi:hypothetical protein [Engelhardtia mirabilis]|uniref:Glycosyltransferase RgtA/B/C/D-like domain-containing protein n=1 Tax=Engelhardtia mirabilis TaxID=2528011 RepID=A0A518BK96_9BACT|nr:hypothetical protein Pla133_24770 [Planctomycetes bacterium Pla133]QDV01721.1 hypothetical protein Pla86_24760 [Planctomycetes bacterium Pla86]